MIKLWISKQKIPQDQRDINGNACQEISLPDQCKDCGHVFKMISAGDSTLQATVHDICEHYDLWTKFWDNRIQNFYVDPQTEFSQPIIGFTVIKARAKKVDAANDGMKCSGSCGNWMPMAAANQADGSFICYGCRSRF